jgi:hypothetical protein
MRSKYFNRLGDMKRQFEAKFVQNDQIWRKRMKMQQDQLYEANVRIRELEG